MAAFNTCEEAGVGLAHLLFTLAEKHKDKDNHEIEELFFLGVAGIRYGVHFTRLLPEKKKRILLAFEKHIVKDQDERWLDLIDDRGAAYFEVIKKHSDNIINENWAPFAKELVNQFELFMATDDGGGIVANRELDIDSQISRAKTVNLQFANTFGLARKMIHEFNLK